ncbi:signal peptidase II [Thalassotalea piscium]|uniref:Lipoprotein signal peptidase n=1 Tax=Thalassotalea piscium TaxID=1230533 RepID=A0A7X0TS38_9GAMM|nr:signal peptidase II [Thalassotalea piscium]MBB6541694.1 signal peptidase II [Thalassotalea piscium]
MKLYFKLLYLLFLTILVISLDQYTKFLAIEFLSEKDTHNYFYDVFRLSYAENSGAFLSLGSGLPKELRYLIFSGLVVVFLVGLAIHLISNLRSHPNYLAGLTFILSGGVSNLYDRLQYGGVVVDFMNLGIGTFRTGIFNVADIAIIIGVVIITFSVNIKSQTSTISPMKVN